MKHMLVFVVLVSVTLAGRIQTQGNVQPDLSKWTSSDIKAELHSLTAPENFAGSQLGISIRFNWITDLILLGVRRLIIRSGLEPLELPDQTIEGALGGINAASISLTNGTLSQLSSLTRGGDVTLTYSSNDRIVLTVPLSFQVLLTTYDYSTRVILSNVKGNLQATIVDLSSELEIGIDLTTNNATLYDVASDVEDVNIVLKGNEGTDWITNALTDLLTPVFKVLVTTTVKSAVEIPAQLFVDALNDYLNR